MKLSDVPFLAALTLTMPIAALAQATPNAALAQATPNAAPALATPNAAPAQATPNAAPAQATPNAAQDGAPTLPRLSLEQQTALRCSAAFALVGKTQARGEAAQITPVAKRGQEFFVRAAAKIMDDTGAGRQTIAAIMQREVAAFAGPADAEATMPACLLLLDASGL